MQKVRDYIDSDLMTTGLDIVCLGDSIFEGLYCGDDYYIDNWAYKLRDILQKHINPAGVGGQGYLPFSFGAYETTRAVWNTRFPNTVPANLIMFDADGEVMHSWQADWAYNMWTRESAARGVYFSGALNVSGKIKHTFTNQTTGVQLIVMKYPDPWDVSVWIDINSTDTFVNFGAGDIVNAVQTIPHTIEPEASYEYATYGGYSYGNHLEQIELPTPASNVTVQIGNDATNNNHLVTSGLVHYNGDYAQGIRLHNLATSGNWAFPETARLQQNVTKWCTQTGGATNARLFLCNLITNDYIYQENQITYNAWKLANPDAQPGDPGYLYNPGLTLPVDSTYYALLMDQIIAANTDPYILWVIPPKPYFGGSVETYTYQQYCDMIYNLAKTRPQVAILDMWEVVGKVERTALTNGWGDIDLTHFTALWQTALADAIGDMILSTEYAYCLNLKNNTWSTIDEFPVGLPIQLSYIGNDLHIEDTILKKVFDCVESNPITVSFRTKRFSFPSPALYKRFMEADIYCDGNEGINFVTINGTKKSNVTLDGVDQADSTTKVSPGGHLSRQKIRNRAAKCFNFSLNLIAEIEANNTARHTISSVTFRVNEKGGIR